MCGQSLPSSLLNVESCQCESPVGLPDVCPRSGVGAVVLMMDLKEIPCLWIVSSLQSFRGLKCFCHSGGLSLQDVEEKLC